MDTTVLAQRGSKRSDKLLFPLILVVACCATPLLVLAATSISLGSLLGYLVILLVLALIIWRPIVGCYIVLVTVVVFESEPLATPILTDNLPIFYWPPSLVGIIERPIGFLLIFIFLVLICRRLIRREIPLLVGGKLLTAFVLFFACVAGGMIHGLISGGNLQETIGEIRPFWYLFLSYLLAINLVTRKSHVLTMIWIIILGAFVKAVQGLYVYLIAYHGDLTIHHTILAHEESFFFVGLLLLLALFILHYRYRPQFYAALLIAPFVLVSLYANQRRTDYVALLLALGVVWVIVFKSKPYARKGLLVLAIVSVTLGGGYILAFSQSTGGFAAPAHAIVSVFLPQANDVKSVDSDLYRTIENNDLKYTVKQYPIIGYGFGKPFLEPVPLTVIYPEVFHDDPIYNYVPHNNIFWIWMRLGAIGFLAFWYLISSIIVRGCLIARELKDSYLQLVAIYIVAMVFVEILAAYADYQLYFFRNVIYIGSLLGVLMRLPAIAQERSKPPL